jgi:CheY-like chemotaxis protein/HAMP domain-containing protein
MSQQRVLVVDDEANTRRVLEIMLQKMGLETRAACNGQDALTLAQRESFELVLTDLRMPEMDGLALLDALRTQKIETLIRFTIPVPDPDSRGTTLGQLVALFDWERETEIIARTRENLVSVGLDAQVLILDARGSVIGGATRPGGPWQLGNTVTLRFLTAEEQRTTGYIDSAAGMLIGHARLPDDLPSCTVVVAEPLANAFAPAHRVVKLLATTLASTLLIALTIALIAARRVTQPLTELTGAAEAVGRGVRPESPVPVRSRDEIGTLTEAFNRMAADDRSLP